MPIKKGRKKLKETLSKNNENQGGYKNIGVKGDGGKERAMRSWENQEGTQ